MAAYGNVHIALEQMRVLADLEDFFRALGPDAG